MQRIKVDISPGACIITAFLILTVPFKWLLAWFLAALTHELCHCLAIYMLGENIFGFTIHPNGTMIHTNLLSNRQTLLCALAGPMGGLLLIPFARHYPQLALCAMGQTLYNLLPIYPLDGGRAIQALSNMLFSERLASILCKAIEIAAVTMLCVLSFAMHTPLPLFIPILFLLQGRRE